jgi:hypothetical protein
MYGSKVQLLISLKHIHLEMYKSAQHCQLQ